VLREDKASIEEQKNIIQELEYKVQNIYDEYDEMNYIGV
jgi:hypothetical protein